jgi:hypothetical protein
MRSTEAIIFNGTFTATKNLGFLEGGIYVLDFILGGSVTATLQRLGPDGTTFITVATALAATGTTGAVYCSAGQYQILFGGAGTGSASVARVPTE